MPCVFTAETCPTGRSQITSHFAFLGFPGGSPGKESTCNVGDLGSFPGTGRFPIEVWVPTPIFWPGEFHGLYSPRGHKESDMTEQLSLCIISGHWTHKDESAKSLETRGSQALWDEDLSW